MSEEVWKPSVTVAAVIERAGRYLMVEEVTREGLRVNQPAGHLEDGESLIDACRRETLEETAHHFIPEYLVGIYRWRHPEGATYLRFTFGGTLLGEEPGRALDEGIVRALWLTAEEVAALGDRHRNPLVAQCLADYRAGRRYPLALISP